MEHLLDFPLTLLLAWHGGPFSSHDVVGHGCSPRVRSAIHAPPCGPSICVAARRRGRGWSHGLLGGGGDWNVDTKRFRDGLRQRETKPLAMLDELDGEPLTQFHCHSSQIRSDFGQAQCLSHRLPLLRQRHPQSRQSHRQRRGNWQAIPPDGDPGLGRHNWHSRSDRHRPSAYSLPNQPR